MTMAVSVTVDTISLAPVYWNHSNPIFKISKNDHIIDVQQFDDIDFVCPYYSTVTSRGHRERHGHHEYYVIYRVSKREYDSCSLLSDTDNDHLVSSVHTLILNCSSPLHRRRFTILFEPFQSIPNAPEYKPGTSYYFITTSTGHADGVHNQYQGACYYHNMKLTVRVCCHDADDDYTYGDNDDAGGLITATSAWRPTAAPSHEYDNNSNNRSADIMSPRPDRRTTTTEPGQMMSSPSHRTSHRRKSTDTRLDAGAGDVTPLIDVTSTCLRHCRHSVTLLYVTAAVAWRFQSIH